jgi:hypothetical protein
MRLLNSIDNAPIRGVLRRPHEPEDSPSAQSAELPRPRLERAMPLTRDTEVLGRHDPTPRIGHSRSQRALVRIHADHIARPIGRHQHARRTRTARDGRPGIAPDLPAHNDLPFALAPRGNVKHEPVDNVPVEIDAQTEITSANAPIRSDRFPKTRTGGRHFILRTPTGSRPMPGQTPVRSSSLTRAVARARQPQFQHRDL